MEGRFMSLQVAILDNVHPEIRRLITAIAPRDWSLSFLAALDPEQRKAALREAEIMFIIGAGVDAALLAAAPSLRFVQKLGAGMDKIDLEACKGRGVAVARLNAGNAVPVAEHTVMLMLAALRRLPYFDRRTRERDWLKEEGRGVQRQLAGKQVGLVGFGAIGREVAKRLQGFDVSLAYYDPFPAAVDAGLAITRYELDALLRTSDVVSLHLPLLPETRNLLSRERLALLKPGATLINCARGGLIDEAALADALDAGLLHAAGLDTFSTEPPGASPLFGRDDVVVTPHLAGATYDNFEIVFRRGMENVALFLAGAPLSPAEIVVQPPAD
jgi:phosphoglycerate dehydrogenase-like enzyme